MNNIKNNKNLLGVSFVVFALTAFSTLANAQSNPTSIIMHMGMNSSSSMQMASSSKTKMNRIFGTVTDVEPSYIIVNGFGRNISTTTFTVNFNASTTYSNGSSTASLGDVTVGSTVFVRGILATSTNTIAANHISLNIDINAAYNRTQGTSSTPAVNQSSTTSSNSDQNRGFFANIFHKLFGWL